MIAINKSVERAVLILEYIADSERPVGISEIARSFGIPKSSASDCLSTLAGMGCLDQSGGGFIIGRRSERLGIRLLERLGIGEFERRTLAELRDSTGLTAVLWQREGQEIVCAASAVDPKLRRLYSSPGSRASLHLTAPGKAVLALSDDTAVGILIGTGCYSVHTSRSIVNYYQLTSALRKIRKQGYAAEVFENDSHIWAVAAAFRHQNGREMAVSLELWSDKSLEPDQREVDVYAAEVIRAAALLSK